MSGLYSRSVEVIVHKPDSDDILGAINAKHGLPVEIRMLCRGSYTTVVRMTVEEAFDVARVINAALRKE